MDGVYVDTLNAKYEVDRIGHITKAEMLKAVRRGTVKRVDPIANRGMVNDDCLFAQHGRLYKDEDVKGLL